MQNNINLVKIGVFKKRYDRLMDNKLKFGCFFLVLFFISLFFLGAAGDAFLRSLAGDYSRLVGGIIFGVAGLIFTTILIYAVYALLSKRNRKLDVHENGFAYYQRDKNIVATWDEIEGVRLVAPHLILRTINNELVEFTPNQQEIEEIEEVLQQRVFPNLHNKIKKRILNGEKVKFGVQTTAPYFSKLANFLVGKSIMVDSNGIYYYEEAEPIKIVGFIEWKLVTEYGLEERNTGVTSFYVKSSDQEFFKAFQTIENGEILLTICAEFTGLS